MTEKTPAETRALKALLDLPLTNADMPAYFAGLSKAVADLQAEGPKFKVGDWVDVVDNDVTDDGGRPNVVYSRCKVYHIHDMDALGIRRYNVVVGGKSNFGGECRLTFNEGSLIAAQ